MKPNLAQVLNTLAHEIRTPLAVSQGYVKLYLDGRLTNADDQRRAFEQTRTALGTLHTLCMDMSKVSALAESTATGPTERVADVDFVATLRSAHGMEHATWSGGAGGRGAITSHNPSDLVQAVTLVARLAFDEAGGSAHAVRADGDRDLIVLAGTEESLPALQAGPDAPKACPVDFVRGGKGLQLIWAAFVLQQDRVHTWTHQEHRAAVGFRFPLGAA